MRQAYRMKLAKPTAGMVVMIVVSGAASAGAPHASLVVNADADLTVPLEINGQPVKLRVDPGLSAIVLNPAAAARLQLRRTRVSPDAVVGPFRLKGSAARVELRVGQWVGQKSLMWFDRNAVEGADGVIGITQLPYAVVTLQLRTPHLGERQLEFPVVGDARVGAIHRRRIAGTEVAFLFSPWRQISQATASAGAHLAQQLGGTWSSEPASQPTLLGILRPVRQMSFRKVLSLDGLTMRRIFVRTSDYAGNYRLPPDGSEDPDEILVIAKSRKPPKLAVIVGADHLSKCSSISYRRKTKRLSLQCLPHAA